MGSKIKILTNTGRKIKPIIFWYGFPSCGLLIKKVVDRFKEDLIIVTTNPALPIKEVERLLCHKIILLDNPNDILERKSEFSDRNFIIHTGWVYKGWLKYDQCMKKKNNAKVIVAVDNRYRGDLRQYFGALYFRLYLKKFFDAALVPGKQGQKLMRFLGMKRSKIYTGLYGAYEEIFKEKIPVQNRNNEFLFIGQLIKRKGIDILISAFKSYKKSGGTWKLRIVGNGPLVNICIGDNIILEKFTKADEIAEKMNHAKVLVLPSRDDNWGTVVCEAAACGMHLITSKMVGANEDIIQSKNGIILDNLSPIDLKKAFLYYQNLSENKLIIGSTISKEAANNYNSEGYYESFMAIIDNLFK